MVFAIVLASKNPNHKMQINMFRGEHGQALEVAKEMVVEHLKLVMNHGKQISIEKFDSCVDKINRASVTMFIPVLQDIQKELKYLELIEYEFECDFDGRNG